jgi:hypothetical protein
MGLTTYPVSPSTGITSTIALVPSNAVVDNWQTSLSLPSGGQEYIYGFVTGGVPSSGFSSGQVASVINADGNIVAALAATTSDTDSFSTSAQYPAIGGVSVSDFSSLLPPSHGSNSSPGASSASDSFTVNVPGSLVVIMALGGGEQSIAVSGVPGFTIDATNFNGVCNQGLPPVIVIGHAYLNPGTYAVTEQTTQCAAGQDPNHAGDLIGAFVFSPATSVAATTTSTLVASSIRTTMTSSSIASATTTGPSLKILSYSLSPAQPVWNSVFAVTVGVQNTGSETLSSLPQLVGQPSDPTVDALGEAPTLTCSPPSPQNPIMPSQQVYLTYNCIAQWNIEKPPSFLKTFISSYANLGQEAVSTIAQSGDASKFAQSVLSPARYNIFLEESQVANIAMTGLAAAGDIEAAAGVIELVASNDITIGVSYGLSLTSTNYQVTGSSDVATVLIPDYKFSEIYQWAAADMADIAISGGLAVAATASFVLCTSLIGCLVPGVLLAASALTGPVTDAVYQHLLTDPVANYTTIVSIAPVPSLITSLPNNTYSQLLFYEYEYKANLDASSQSSLLGYAAFQANSSQYASLQFARAESFASNASAYYRLFKHYLNLTLLAVAPSVNQTSFDQGVRMMRTGALPTPLVQILNATGTLSYFNSTAITSMTYRPANSTIAQSLPNVGSYLESDASLQISYTRASTSTSSTSTTSSSSVSSPQSTTVPTSPVSGFPIESILAGILGGLLALTIIRRRRKCSERGHADIDSY